MTKTGIMFRALLGAPEPALEECHARARAIEAKVAKFLPVAKQWGGGPPKAVEGQARPHCRHANPPV